VLLDSGFALSARPGMTNEKRIASPQGHGRDKPGHDEEGYAVITGLVPVIPLRSAQLCQMNRDGRDIGVRKHAVLRTALPGHDD